MDVYAPTLCSVMVSHGVQVRPAFRSHVPDSASPFAEKVPRKRWVCPWIVQARPREWRWRAVGGWTWRRAAGRGTGREVVARAGWERVRNFGFAEDADRSNLLGELGVAVPF